MICARCLGMPVAAVLAHSETLRQMKYTIKTVYGISEDFYQGTEDAPLAGTGQGSGASPAVWLTICIVILAAYCKKAPQGMAFSDPTCTINSTRHADAFVDDTALGINDGTTNPIDLSTMLTILTECAQLWETLLFASGKGGS